MNKTMIKKCLFDLYGMIADVRKTGFKCGMEREKQILNGNEENLCQAYNDFEKAVTAAYGRVSDIFELLDEEE